MLLEITFSLVFFSFFFTFLPPDFHELLRCVMIIHPMTKFKQQWATLLVGWVTVSVLGHAKNVSDFNFFCREIP